LDEPVKLVFKLHLSTWDLANVFKTLLGPGEFSELAPPLPTRRCSSGQSRDTPGRDR